MQSRKYTAVTALRDKEQHFPGNLQKTEAVKQENRKGEKQPNIPKPNKHPSLTDTSVFNYLTSVSDLHLNL